jgi:hypothetical protein
MYSNQGGSQSGRFGDYGIVQTSFSSVYGKGKGKGMSKAAKGGMGGMGKKGMRA